MRKGKLEHVLTTGKIEGKRSRGRQRIKIQDGIAAWLGRSTAEMFVDARDGKVEGHDRLRLQQARQLKKNNFLVLQLYSALSISM